MLTIVVGSDWIANRNFIFKQIAHDVHEKKDNRILLVPELISHDAERRLAQEAGDTSSRYAQVLSFTRLVRVVSEYVECAPMPCLDNGGRIIAMAAVIRQLNNKLKSYASVQSHPEFLAGLVETIDEFKRCCISSSDLRMAAARTEGLFAQKLEELSLIYDAYDGITMSGKRDPRDQMTWLLEQVEASDFAENHVFYIDGFPDFTRQHASLLEHFMQSSPDLTISFHCDEIGSDKLAFEKAGKSALQALSFAKNNRIPYRIVIVDPLDRPAGRAITNVFQGKIGYDTDCKKYLNTVQTDSVYHECLHAAQRILELVHSGCRYRDIGIVCSDLKVYENSLHLVFEKSGIPIYRSGKDDVLLNNVFSGIYSAIHAALNGFDSQDVIRYMKSMLCAIDQAICDRVENYSILWGINGKSWTSDWEANPRGLVDQWIDKDKIQLKELNKARCSLIDPLNKFSVAFRNAGLLSEQIEALYVLFEDIGLAQRLADLADYMDDTGDNRSAQILNQLWEILVSALEQLHDVLGNTVWDEDSFPRLLCLLLSQYDVGTIPTVLDAVMVGPVSVMRCHETKHLFVLGVAEGKLPGYSGSVGILTDREREALRMLDVPLTGGGTEGLQSEFGEIYAVLTSASESLNVSYSEGQPSFVFSRLSTISGNISNYSGNEAAIINDPESAAAFLASLGAEKEADLLGLRDEYRLAVIRSEYGYGIIDPANIRALYGTTMNVSASQIEKQAECKFSYFLKYGLHAKELKEAKVDPAQFGTYFHAVLENTVRAVMNKGGFHKISLEEINELALKFSENYIKSHFSDLESARMTYLFDRNVEELKFLIQELWNELRVSLFEPTLLEVGFGEKKALPPVEIPGAVIPAFLDGIVDRVDQWNDGYNNYFRIVDYKTGKKSFDLCDVFNGIGLQMLLYMFALESQGHFLMGDSPLPVGVQYFSARFPYDDASFRLDPKSADSSRGKLLKRKGLILADENVIHAMEPEGAPSRIGVKIKDGSVTGDCANREQFVLLRKYVFTILRKLVAQIASGNVDPNPYTRGNYGACSFCPYGNICHKESVEGRRDYKTMDTSRFWSEVEREVKRDG